MKLESRWVTTKRLYCKNRVFTFYVALWGPCELITYIRVLLTCLLKRQHRCDGFWLKKMHDFTRVGWKSSVIQRGLEVLACPSTQDRPQASRDDGKDTFVLSMPLPLIHNLMLWLKDKRDEQTCTKYDETRYCPATYCLISEWLGCITFVGVTEIPNSVPDMMVHKDVHLQLTFKGSSGLFWLLWAPGINMVHRYTCKQTTPAHKIVNKL